MDPIDTYKAAARVGWSTFAPFEMITGTTAPELALRRAAPAPASSTSVAARAWSP